MEECTQGVVECSMAGDRFSYNDGHKWGDKEVGVERGDRGTRVLREVPLVPLVPYILENRGIRDIREVRVVPCSLVVLGVLVVGTALEQGRDMVVVEGEEVEHNTLVHRLEHRLMDIRNHRGWLPVSLYLQVIFHILMLQGKMRVKLLDSYLFLH